ncbi:sugar ABC transporter permease [Vallicoccus soli]|uniref:Xylose transport system permease protein XylH n=1 Tax=Vallicoccus soli TaxID=2339232 RepID=A0A3A3YX49_9ACTN|nr:ABC transporter permease [Vallicoccus soli]RJK96249.1 ABC transporter permease [Vallicoccus soli]
MTQLPDTAPAPGPGPADDPAAGAFRADRQETSVGGAVRAYVDRIRGGDLGALPAVLGLLALCALFTALRPETFPTALNVNNLLVQAVPITLLAMGLVFVLLLGEIDLSAGVVSGVCAAVLAQMLAVQGASWWVATLAALAAGALIGLVTGSLVALVGIPSFVVTLALFLGLQGATLRIIGEGGTVPVRDEVVRGIANSTMPVAWGWGLAVAGSLVWGALSLLGWQRKHARGLARQPLPVVVAKVVVVSVLVLATVAVLSADRALNPAVELAGVPYAVPLVVVLLVALSFVLGRTAFGRHVYAVGGNAEAARRAGIPVARIRVAAFVISSTMAAVSGIAAASRLSSVTPGSGAGNTLLYAVGAAVIGGTSLFGGRGRVRDALLGGLVIAAIANGLGLLGVEAYLNYLITGGVLLLAASVDALARRRAAATGH